MLNGQGRMLRLPALRPTARPSIAKPTIPAQSSKESTAMLKSLPLVLCLSLSLTGCGAQLKHPTEPLPANLRQPCPKIPDPPTPLIDPARGYWEAEIIRLYGVCGSRMLAAIKATTD